MFIIVILGGIAITVEGCFISMPRGYHKVPAKLIWGIMSALALNIASSFFVASGSQLAAILSVSALGIYFLLRAITFIGLASSFQAYGVKNEVPMYRVGMPLALLASFGDIIAIFVTYIVMTTAAPQPGIPFTPHSEADYNFVFMLGLAFGIFLCIAFLLAMNSNKNKVEAFERKIRKQIVHAVLQAKTPRPSGKI